MTVEGSSLIGFENERAHVSTTSYNFATNSPNSGRRDKSLVAKILILSVSLLAAFILISFIARRVSSSSSYEITAADKVAAAGLVGHFKTSDNTPPSSYSLEKLLNREPTYERIMAQYGYQVKDTEKLILIWSDWSDTSHSDYNLYLGKKFCKFTRDKSMINSSDAVVFRNVSHEDDLPDRPNSKQIWIFNHRKPDSFNLTKHKHSFNWTATHRFDSHVPHLYKYLWITSKNQDVNQYEPIKKYIQPKNDSDFNAAVRSSVKVAVYLTDCNNTEIRDYIDTLRQYINLDCYCTHGMLHGNSTIDQPIPNVFEWFKRFKDQYKFYLALEEKLCDYYITDQFFEALRRNTIPIVRGNKDVYEKIAPTDSYIHMDSFENKEHLAQYLEYLAENTEEIDKYFRWKKTTRLSQVYWYTQLCNLVQGTSGEETFTIENINDEISMC